MALHALDPADLRDPARPAGGRLRAPAVGERELVATWGVAFVIEADTNLANRTSNKIYAEVGYRLVAGWEQHTLVRSGSAR
jgi:hypothetical protein